MRRLSSPHSSNTKRMTKLSILKHKIIRAYHNPKNWKYSRFKGYPENTYFGFESLNELIKHTVKMYVDYYGKSLKNGNMTKEDKELLLLKDLCARLPYGVKVQPCGSAFPHKFIGYDKGLARIDTDQRYELDDIKPYLRPMSSMIEEEWEEWRRYKSSIAESSDELLDQRIDELHDWFYRNHIDFRGLIPKGLALEAPVDMYNLK